MPLNWSVGASNFLQQKKTEKKKSNYENSSTIYTYNVHFLHKRVQYLLRVTTMLSLFALTGQMQHSENLTLPEKKREPKNICQQPKNIKY